MIAEDTSKRMTLGPVGMALLHKSPSQQFRGPTHRALFWQPLVMRPVRHDRKTLSFNNNKKHWVFNTATSYLRPCLIDNISEMLNSRRYETSGVEEQLLTGHLHGETTICEDRTS